MCISEFLIDSDSFLSSNSAEWPLFPFVEQAGEVLARLKLELTFRPAPLPGIRVDDNLSAVA